VKCEYHNSHTAVRIIPDAWFFSDVTGAEPATYQWHVLSPWMTGFEPLSGATNSYLQWTNADLWDDWTLLSLSVSNATGETLWLGPAALSVYPLSIAIPGTNTSGSASRYPATINVRGEPTNGLEHVEVTLHNLRHAYPADLDILLVSPSGAKIMLMSDAGGSTPVTNATLVFHPASQNKPSPPEQGPIPSNIQSQYSPWNYGDLETQLPGAPIGPYTDNLDNMFSTDPDPNGIWELYIYDDKNGQTGILQDSWSLRFFYAP
jgi:subtilisin-like proprotein convertase family protein